MIVEKPWVFDDDQTITIGERKYNVHAAIFMADKLPVKKLALDEMYIEYCAPCKDNFRDFIAHIKLVNDADLSYPIILNENGALIDGKHRLAKAILEGRKTILAKRFVKEPASIWRYAE